MVQINKMKIISKIVIFVSIVFFFSCEEQGLIINCSDCYADEPETAELEINLDQDYYGSQTVINIYEGNLEDSILYKTLYVSDYQTTVPVTINKKYTVTAEYHRSDNYYITVDSATPRVKFEKSQCDEACYFVYDKICNLRLKYTE